METLVAISILLISISAPLTIASRSLQDNYLATERLTANMLAQEGVEAVVALQRDSIIEYVRTGTGAAWDWYDTTSPGELNNHCVNASRGCPMDFSNGGAEPVNVYNTNCGGGPNACRLQYDDTAGRARYNHSTGVDTPFHRVIKVLDAGTPDEQVMVESRVFWDSPHASTQQEVFVRTVLMNLATST